MRKRKDEEQRRRRTLRIREIERDLDDELAFHLAETVDELVTRGMGREEAEAEARRRFGDETRYRAALEATDRLAEEQRLRRDTIGAAAQTLRFALRSVRRSAGLSAGIVLTLALGIGANATMFSTIDRLLLSAPTNLTDLSTLRRVWVERPDRTSSEIRAGAFSYPGFMDLDQSGVFPAIAGYDMTDDFLGEGPGARPVTGWLVTGDFWDVLGVRPHIGRFFTEEEDGPDADPVVVLSHDLWQSTFAGDPLILGRAVRVGALMHTVVGVAPPGFTGPEVTPADVWFPFHQRYHQWLEPLWGEDVLGRGQQYVNVIARIDPDTPSEVVEDRARAVYLAGRQERIEAGREPADQRIVLAPLKGHNRASIAYTADREAAVARWLGGVTLLLLIIACTNVANLLLARSIRHRRETAIRLALGVSRRRLVLQAGAEGLLLAAVGGAGALALTQWGGWLVQRTVLPDVLWTAPFSGRLVLFVLGVTVAAGLLSSVLPALQASRYAARGPLRVSAGGDGHSSARVRERLIIIQAALSVVLLVGAGLFVRSLDRAEGTDLGFDPDRLLVVAPWFISGSVLDRTDPAWRAFVERARERLAELPGIAAAARYSDQTGTPLGPDPALGPRLGATGHDSVAVPGGARVPRFRVSPEFLDVLGLDVLQGRGLEAGDRADSEPVAVASRSLATHLWPNESAIDKCLFVGTSGQCSRIVGVVPDVKVRALDETSSFAYYQPLDQAEAPVQTILVRTEQAGCYASDDGARARSGCESGPVVDLIRRELTAMDGSVRFVNVLPMVRGREYRAWRLGAILFTVFGLLAAIVAAIGLYSVLAFDVEQRRREIGLRTALGASRDGVMAMFVRRATKLTVTGSAVGVVLALVLGPRVQHLLFQTSARDPLTFGAIVVALVLTGVAASGVPAWRAARVDPNVVLREE